MKLQEFQQELKKKRIDVTIFITSSYNNIDPNINYFTGMNAEWCSIIIPAINKGKPFFILPRMELEKAKKLSRIRKILPVKPSQTLAELLTQNISGIKTIGINKNNLTIAGLESLRRGFRKQKQKVIFKDISKIISDARSIKSEHEIAKIRTACRLTDKIFSEIVINFKNFRTEKDIAKFIEKKAQEFNVKPSFPAIIASGKNASMPHYTPKDTPIQKGFCIMDFGVKFKGYCADMTRTVYIGNPSIQEIKVYQTLLNAQKKAISLCKPNKKANILFKESSNELGPFKKYFLHGLGHGIGVEIHEAPSLSLKSKDILREGMIFTIEPGIYVPNKFGMRIEDDILVTKNGPKILTKSSKNLICLKY